MKSHSIKYFSSGESDGADTEYIYINYKVDPSCLLENTKKYETSLTSYNIINTNDKYRSVILSYPENILLSFSPIHSISVEEFIDKNPEITDDIYINECIEGTMIQLFYDPRVEKWEIATKSAVGANYWYYRTQYGNEGSEYTFKQMFLSAFRADLDSDINTLPFLEYLQKEYSYTFVLKHPLNHIVQTVEYPIVYLVAVYHICDDRAIYIPPIIYEEWDCFLNIRGIIEFPQSFDESKYEFYMSNWDNKNYNSMGYMMTNLKTGERCHIENSFYSYLKELRGNHPNLQYCYLELVKNNQLQEFLNYFPRYEVLFNWFYLKYCEFLDNLHYWYVSIYIKKEGKRSPKKYFPIIYKLHHEIFIPSMAAGKKKVMKKPIIDNYLSKLGTGSLIHYMNLSDSELEQNIIR